MAEVTGNIVTNLISAFRGFGRAAGIRRVIAGLLFWMIGVSVCGQVTITNVLYNNICQGATVIVEFTSTGPFNSDNEYTVQLSDASGNFTSPYDIGTIADATGGNKSIETTTITTPGGIGGPGYRIRVISTNPAYQSSEVAVNIYDALVPSISVDPVLCFGTSTGSITVTTTGGTSPYLYSINGGPTQVSGIFSGLTAGNYTVTIQDINGCQLDAENIPITEPAAALTVTETNVDVLCFGQSTGSIDLTVAGGTTPYTYSWSSGATTQDLTNIPAGNYSVTVTDDNGCTASIANIQITQPAAVLTVTETNVDVLCFGQSTGSIDLTVAGGTTPYTYSWSSGATTQDLTNIPAGNYSVTVTDDNGCTASIANIQITQPAAVLTVTETNVDVLCFGQSTGSIDLTVAGGTTPYTYSWSSGATTQDLTNIPAGNYSVTVTDDNGCTASIANIQITQPAAVLTVTETNVDVLCFGQSTGSIDLTVAGGTTPYTYSWSSGATTQDLTNIPAGNYSVTVTDDNGCTASIANIQITQPAAVLTVTETNVDVLCFGQSTGSIDLTVAGGTTPYTYSWSSGATTQDLTNIPAGNYSVTVTDDNGCTASIANIQITQPAAVLTVTETNVDVLCFGQSTGSIDLTVAGGTTPYTYSWSSGATTQDLTNIPAGNYSVTVTDDNGCTASIANIQITQPAAVLTVTETNVDVLCFGQSTGSIDLTVAGGTTPYTYSWSSSATTQDLTNIPAGNYSVTVTDDNGCTASIANIQITQPAAVLTVTETNVDVLCFGQSTGSIDLTVAGGTTPYTYSWSSGATTQDLTNIPAGNYSVTVTDDNGCTASIANIQITQPAAVLTVTETNVDVLCFGQSTGSIDLTVAGGTTPYTYSWSSGATTQDLTNIPAGNYSVTVTDDNGCTASIANIQITQPAAVLTVTETNVDVLCFGQSTGSIDLTVAGGTTPYTYSWSSGATTQDLTNIPAGNYSVTVTDDNGCTASIANIQITQPAAVLTVTETNVDVLCFGQSTGSIDLTVAGGTTPYTYSWSSGATTQDLTNIPAGNYSVTVTDDNGCTASIANIQITQPAAVLTVTETNVDVLCFGQSTGSIDLTVAGGTTPYTYSWSSGATTQDLTNIPAGNYSATVTDDNGCTASIANIQITQPAAVLTVTETNVDVLCFGQSTGSIDLTVAGGTTPYTYSWSSGATTQDLTNIPAGNYSVTVTDDNGCTASIANIQITQPTAALSAIISAQTQTCFGQSTGTATVSAAGGTLDYEYSSDGTSYATSSTLTGLGSGLNTLYVRDANNCITTVNVVITSLPELNPGAHNTESITVCQNYNPEILTFTTPITGGRLPYTYQWYLNGDPIPWCNSIKL